MDEFRKLRDNDQSMVLAQEIADYLFNDLGLPVERLVLSRKGEDNGRSGWSKQPVIDHIYRRLCEQQGETHD